MINYISTRDPGHKVSSSEAILKGQAPDGGLYIPESMDQIKKDYHEIINNDFKGMARAVWSIFFDDYSSDKIEELVERSYTGKFSSSEITPLVKTGREGAYVLELYHGPTSAFKDVALSALPNLMTAARSMNDFSDVPGTGIIVFYPYGGVSDTQRLQMVTAPGSNTRAVAVRGNFDDAQTGVKQLFRDIPQPKAGVSLSSANSINIGRLVPQIVYYFSAYRQLLDMGAITDGDMVDYIVPTGNFGDIMAGYFAKKMGLPVGRLVCASNKNDVLAEFLETGHYNRKRPFHKTTSPSMDILVSSNLERLLYYVCGADHALGYMKELSENGEYTISSEELAEIRSLFTGLYASDEEGAAAIKEEFESDHYLMDTHTAIAWSCMNKYRDSEEGKDAAAYVVLSTASPYKFSRAVLEAIGEDASGTDRENMEKLHKITGAPVPAGLAGVFDREVRHEDVIKKDEIRSYVVENC